ncbi:hypothetical protein TIFTF001_012293 [Ficus carica]|uniref:Uncharacterized protein n=1 Tax=Ficus carica TaxID=3494 RepID=A0AA87ZVR2_FICCA|nr:hypothetical protein TIFTF001_012293 [Ficus carica]
MGTSSCSWASRPIVEAFNNIGLIDMGASGPRLTWSNGSSGWNLFKARLDRAMMDVDWKSAFPRAALEVIPEFFSDPLLSTEGELFVKRQFKFKEVWTRDRRSTFVVKKA